MIIALDSHCHERFDMEQKYVFSNISSRWPCVGYEDSEETLAIIPTVWMLLKRLYLRAFNFAFLHPHPHPHPHKRNKHAMFGVNNLNTCKRRDLHSNDCDHTFNYT